MSARPRLIANESGRLSPVLIIVGAAVVAFVVALLTMGAGSSGSKDTAAGGQTTGDSKGSDCGDGGPDPSYTVNLTSDPSPPRPEGTTFHLAVRHNGDPVTGAKVCLSADMPTMQHSGLTKTAKESSGGAYDATDIRFPMGGSWAASVTILEPGKPAVLLTTAFQVNE